MPRIYLSNDAADVSGYKLAYVDMRSPSSTALSTSVTATTAGGDNIQATDTSGGTALKWITKPFLAAQTLVTPVQVNIWSLESNAAANAGIGVNLYPYSAASEGSVFLDANGATELTTTAAATRFTTAAATSQAFAAGDRLVIKLYAVAVGTMGDARTVTIDYGGPTAGADGDSYIDIVEPFRVNETQVGNGAATFRAYESTGNLVRLQNAFQYGIDAGYWTSSASIRSAMDLVQYELNILSPRSSVSTPV